MIYRLVNIALAIAGAVLAGLLLAGTFSSNAPTWVTNDGPGNCVPTGSPIIAMPLCGA